MPHQELIIQGQRIPSVTEWLDVMDKKWLRGWYAKEELKRCIEELAELQLGGVVEDPTDPKLLMAGVKHILARWRKRVKLKVGETDWAADGKSKAAASIGTEFHSWVEWFLNGCNGEYQWKPELVTAVTPLIGEFQRFHKDWQFNPTVGQEIHVVSKKYVYQGTFDFLGTTNKFEGLGLFDWKTSNKIDDTYGLQIALYAYAYGEQKGWTETETWDRIRYGGSVRLDKYTHQLEYQLYDNLPYLFRVASALREPYDYRNLVGAWEADND
jgi:hypothetical protein